VTRAMASVDVWQADFGVSIEYRTAHRQRQRGTEPGVAEPAQQTAAGNQRRQGSTRRQPRQSAPVTTASGAGTAGVADQASSPNLIKRSCLRARILRGRSEQPVRNRPVQKDLAREIRTPRRTACSRQADRRTAHDYPSRTPANRAAFTTPKSTPPTTTTASPAMHHRPVRRKSEVGRGAERAGLGGGQFRHRPGRKRDRVARQPGRRRKPNRVARIRHRPGRRRKPNGVASPSGTGREPLRTGIHRTEDHDHAEFSEGPG
jgi:hypothetical protein